MNNGMTTREQAIAGALVQNDRFGWIAGMQGVQYFSGMRSVKWRALSSEVNGGASLTSIPDLRDEATVGCLWSMVLKDAGDLSWWDLFPETPRGPGQDGYRVCWLLHLLWDGQIWAG